MGFVGFERLLTGASRFFLFSSVYVIGERRWVVRLSVALKPVVCLDCVVMVRVMQAVESYR